MTLRDVPGNWQLYSVKSAPPTEAGVDVLNFGSEDRDTTVTAGGGFRYLVGDHLQFGAAYEVPLTDEDNTIIDHRIYFDVVVHF